MGVFDLLDLLLDGLAVSHHGLADVSFHLELALHPVHDDVQVQLAHTADNGLAGFLVQTHGKGRVFFGQLLDGDTHLFLVGL